MPIAAANTASSTRIPVTSAVLSCAPNALIAKSFTGGGVRSMVALPTATTGEPSAPVMPATSWPTPSATAAVIRPVNRPMPTPGRVRGAPGGGDCGSEDTVTSSIRCRHRQGLAAGGGSQSDPPSATNHREEPLLRFAVGPFGERPGGIRAICGQGEDEDARMTAELPGER